MQVWITIIDSTLPRVTSLRRQASPDTANCNNPLPAQLLVKTEGVVVVMLRENFAVLEMHETNTLKAKGALSGWGLGTPGAGIGALELPFKGNVLSIDNRLAEHFPLQIRHRLHEHLNYLGLSVFAANLRCAHRGVEKLNVIRKILGRRIRIVGIPSLHIVMDHAEGIVLACRKTCMTGQNQKQPEQ